MTDDEIEVVEDDFGRWWIVAFLAGFLFFGVGFCGILWVGLHQNYEITVLYDSSSQINIVVGESISVEKINYMEISIDGNKTIIDSPKKYPHKYNITIPKNAHITVDVCYLDCHKDRVFDNVKELIKSACVEYKKPIIDKQNTPQLIDFKKEYTFGTYLVEI
jgi:hypothetical protein